eukprot:6168019-Amphidinium_carterae.1
MDTRSSEEPATDLAQKTYVLIHSQHYSTYLRGALQRADGKKIERKFDLLLRMPSPNSGYLCASKKYRQGSPLQHKLQSCTLHRAKAACDTRV